MKVRYIGILILFIPVAGFGQSMSRANTLHKKGMEYRSNGHYKRASDYLGKAYHLYKNQAADSIWIPAGFDYAVSLTDQAKFGQALPLLGTLQDASYTNYHVGLRANIENEIGLVYYHTSREDSALAHYKKALQFAEKADNENLIGAVTNNIGGIYSRQGDYLNSLKYREKSLRIFKQTNKKQNVAILLNNIGVIYENLSLLDSARIKYRRSLAIKKELGNVNLLATAYNNLANVLSIMGYYNKALLYFNKSLELGKQTGTKYEVARTLNNIGVLYKKLGQEQNALAYYRQSLRLQKQFSKPELIAINYKNIGNRLWDLGKRKKAIQTYRKALFLSKQTESPQNIANSLFDLARVELEQGELEKFATYMSRAKAITNTLQNPYLLKRQYLLTGKADSARDRPLLAIQNYKEAVSQSTLINPEASIAPLGKLARAFQPFHPDSAIYYGWKAIRIIEDIQKHASSIARFQSGYFEKYAPFYIDMAAWIIDNNHNIPLAYQLIEESKARVLTGQLARLTLNANPTLTEKERIDRAQKLSDISTLRRKLKQTNDNLERQEIQNKIRSRQLDYDVFINHIHQENPRYKAFKKPKPISLATVQEFCPPKTAILEYAINGKRIIIFMITRDKVKIKSYSLRRYSLRDLVIRFRQAITTRAPQDTLQKLSQPLYHHLIAPFRAFLTSFKNLLIVPSGFLAYLPFEALVHDNHYLITKYNIKYAPSMTGFSLIQKPDARFFKEPLVIGNSSKHPKNIHVPVLAGVDLEMEYLKQVFPDALVVTGKKLDEQHVRELLLKKDYPIVHFATHGIINEQNPSLSGIIVGKRIAKKDIRNDGFLRRSEISRLKIPSDLVVLSACETARGPVISGEGMLGLQQAFFIAGASSVVVSLWNVYDRATARLMKKFYHLLKTNHNSWSNTWHTILHWVKRSDAIPFGEAAQAMYQAKLDMLHSPKYHDPVFWAPFIVIGR